MLGRLFYGELEYSGPDPGPSAIRWRLIESAVCTKCQEPAGS